MYVCMYVCMYVRLKLRCNPSHYSKFISGFNFTLTWYFSCSDVPPTCRLQDCSLSLWRDTMTQGKWLTLWGEGTNAVQQIKCTAVQWSNAQQVYCRPHVIIECDYTFTLCYEKCWFHPQKKMVWAHFQFMVVHHWWGIASCLVWRSVISVGATFVGY